MREARTICTNAANASQQIVRNGSLPSLPFQREFRAGGRLSQKQRDIKTNNLEHFPDNILIRSRNFGRRANGVFAFLFPADFGDTETQRGHSSVALLRGITDFFGRKTFWGYLPMRDLRGVVAVPDCKNLSVLLLLLLLLP